MFAPALLAMLDRALAAGSPAVEPLAAELDAAFGRTCAVLVVDLSGFTRREACDGVASALLEIRRMQLAGAEAIARHGGELVKCEADNLFATFPDVAPAWRAARELQGQVSCAAGIDFGRILRPDGDLFGGAVNAASRKGEDLAQAGEILLTDAATTRLVSQAV